MQHFFFIAFILFVYGTQAQNGNVGIGITSPAEKLHVAGNIKADTLKPNAFKLTADAATGKVLTSDAAGNASWQTATTTGSGSTNTNGSIGYGLWGDCATNTNVSEYQPVADLSGPNGKNLGYSVTMQGNWALVGAPLDSNFKGTAHLYQFDGTQWVLKQKLTDPDGAQGDRFGNTVCLSGNFAFVGAPEDSVAGGRGEGSFCIFKFNGSSWVFLQKLSDPGAGVGSALASSLSASGNWAVAGLPGRKIGNNIYQGVANLYQYDGNLWILKQTVYNAAGVEYGYFGRSVSLNNDFLFVGEEGDSSNGSIRTGSATVFKLSGNNWVQHQKLIDKTSYIGNFTSFGASVSVSDGYAIVGAYGYYVSNQSIRGAVLFYKYDGTKWVKTQRFYDNSSGASDFIGQNVCLSGKYAIAGRRSSTVIKQEAILFYRVGDIWLRLQALSDPTGIPGDYFGSASAVDGTTKRFCLGAFGAYNSGEFPNTSIGSSGKLLFGKVN